MTILLVSQFFPPDVAAVGVLLGELADGLTERGIAVRVICGEGGYGAFSPVSEHSGRNLAVERIRNLRFSHSTAGKVASYLSFYVGAAWRAVRAGPQDIVLTMTAPPGLAWIGWLLQRTRGTRHVVWEMDVYPDIAVALGMKAVGAFGWFLDFPRNRADAVIALGEDMKARLASRGVPPERVHICENWADGLAVRPSALWPAPHPLRILYSGNLGMAHEVDTILRVMERLRDDDRFEFVFAGGGPRRKAMEAACLGFPHVTFRSWSGKNDLSANLNTAHLGLVTQRPETVGAVVPSKVYGLMAAGRPVLYIGPADATPAGIVRRHQCGWHRECGDVAGIVSLLESLAREPDRIREAGSRARLAFDTGYDRQTGVRRVIAALLGTETACGSS